MLTQSGAWVGVDAEDSHCLEVVACDVMTHSGSFLEVAESLFYSGSVLQLQPLVDLVLELFKREWGLPLLRSSRHDFDGDSLSFLRHTSPWDLWDRPAKFGSAFPLLSAGLQSMIWVDGVLHQCGSTVLWRVGLTYPQADGRDPHRNVPP